MYEQQRRLSMYSTFKQIVPGKFCGLSTESNRIIGEGLAHFRTQTLVSKTAAPAPDGIIVHHNLGLSFSYLTADIRVCAAEVPGSSQVFGSPLSTFIMPLTFAPSNHTR